MKKILFSVLVAILCMGFVSAQTNIYVSAEKGDDANDGTSWQTAYQTIDKALDQLNGQAGTYNIYVAQGEYLFEDNDNFGGNNNNEYHLGHDQIVNIYGGYPTPYEGLTVSQTTANPAVYTTAFDTRDNLDSAFRLLETTNAKLFIKDATILFARGGASGGGVNRDGGFITFDETNGASFTLDNVIVNDWDGDTTGFSFVYNSSNTTINIVNSLIERVTSTSNGTGQFVRVNDQNKGVKITVDNTIFRNIRGSGTRAPLFLLDLDCNVDDQAESWMVINNSKFFNIKKGRAAGQNASVLVATSLPKLTLTNNIFQGNVGGDGGILEFRNSGQFLSQNNIYQDNQGGQVGGAVYIRGNYGCSPPPNVFVDRADFINDEFISNQAGIDNISGYGGAIFIAGPTSGGGTGPSEVNKIVNIKDSKFMDNSTSAYNGGAIFANMSQKLTIDNSVFCNNRANTQAPSQNGNGGAIFMDGSGDFEVIGSTFLNNDSGSLNGGDGAAFKTITTGAVSVNGCSYFEGNTTAEQGGAIYGDNYSSFVIDGATFVNNKNIGFIPGTLASSFDGGTIYLFQSNVTAEIRNTTFNGSSSYRDGGTIWTNGSLILEDVEISNSTTRNNGGAIYINGDEINLTRVKINDNESINNHGGGVYGGASTDIIINTAEFLRNKSNDHGGAIYADQYVKVTDALFDSNTSGADGGAIKLVENTSRPIELTTVNFTNNNAGTDGGALYFYGGSNANLILNETYFYKNETLSTSSTQGRGGAVYLQDFGIVTGSETTSLGNVVFKENKSNRLGGAIYIDKTGSQDILLYSGRYIDNDGGNRGGAVYFNADNGTSIDHNINGNHFVENEADERGGAIFIADNGVNEVDQMNNNRFWMNTLNDDPNNTIITQRSDIALGTSSSNVFDAKIVEMTENYLQFDPTTTYYRTNNTNSIGYNLVGNNYKQTANNNPPTLTASAFDLTNIAAEAICSAGECPEKFNTPPSPIVVSTANTSNDINVNSGDPEDYTAFNKVTVDSNSAIACDFYESEIAFTLRSNNAPTLTGEGNTNFIIPPTTPEVSIEYVVIVVNNFTGESATYQRTIDLNNSTRIEDPSQEIFDGEQGNYLRDVYKTYFLDVTNDIQPGYSYAYSIVGAVVPEINSDGNVENRTYEFPVGKYKTELVADFCPCTIGTLPGDTNVKSTQVGISTLDRNTDEWLTANNKKGAYIILESTKKGFVVPRYTDQNAIDVIGTTATDGVEQGMIVWDTAANCLKMFYDKNGNGTATWNCISDTTCNNTTP